MIRICKHTLAVAFTLVFLYPVVSIAEELSINPRILELAKRPVYFIKPSEDYGQTELIDGYRFLALVDVSGDPLKVWQDD
jgi:hypothetical protein